MKRILPLVPLAIAFAAPTAGLLAADARAPFDNRERNVLRAVANDVSSAFKDDNLPVGIPLSALRIAGDDRGDWVLSQLKIAATKGGLNYVEGRMDPMWDAIIAEIEWDEYKGDMLDEQTLTKFGRLQAARLLLYGRLILGRYDDGRPHAELTLHISNVETKQHIWGDTFFREEAPPPPPPVPDGAKVVVSREPLVYAQDPAEALLSVQVVARTGDGLDKVLASRLVPVAEDELADRGFSVVDTPTPDILVTVAPSMDLFDRTGESYSFRGVVPVSAKMPPLGNKGLAADELRATGPLTLDQEPAVAALAGKLADPLRDWIDENVTAEKAGLRVRTLAVSYHGIGPQETSARIAQFCAAAAEMRGVLSCTLAERLPTGNQAVYRIVSMAGSFPAGFIHTLRKDHPELKLIPVIEREDESPAQ